VEARVYSGRSGSELAATHNYVPVTLVDVRIAARAEFEQELPASYNGFLYLLEGDVSVGAQRARLSAGQVGWLANTASESTNATTLRITAGDHGARLVLYAGERQRVPIVMRGPFVGESREDLLRVSRQYIDGKMPRISELAVRQA
jgi:hypothetical protein